MFQKAKVAASIATLGPFPVVLTDVVWDEFVEGPKRNGANATTIADAAAIATAVAGKATDLFAGTPEAEAFAKLCLPPMTEHVGELSLIAYATVHADVTAVLLDRKALHRGVEELRGRVLSLHSFLEALETNHRFPRAISAAVSTTLARQQHFRPHHLAVATAAAGQNVAPAANA